MALNSEPGALGTVAPPFTLKGVIGHLPGYAKGFITQPFSLDDFSIHAKGVLVIFMCNHCPYVLAVKDRINELAMEFMPRGIPVIGINSNDAVKYPADSWEQMVEKAKEWGFVFPYLYDETQEVARAYGAVCTPDCFLFSNDGGNFTLRYRGRIDDSWKDPAQVKKRELAEAMTLVLAGRPVPEAEQKSSMGCSIKWK